MATGCSANVWAPGNCASVPTDPTDPTQPPPGGGLPTIFFDPKNYGATADTDSQAELQATFDAAASMGGAVWLSQVYKTLESINIHSVPIYGPGEINGSEATTLSLGNAVLYSAGSLVNLGQPSFNLTKGKATAILFAAPDIANGDRLIVGSEENFSNARTAYRKGESAIVNKVIGTQIDIYGAFFDNYDAGQATLFKLVPVSPTIAKTVTVRAPNFAGARGVRVKNGRNVAINCKVVGAGTKAVELQQCFESEVNGALFLERRENGDTTTGTEYGLVLANCQAVTISNSVLVGERHGFTTGGFDNDYSDFTVALVCRSITITGNVISNDSILASHLTGGATVESFDLHGNSEYVTCTGNVIINGAIWAGNNGTFTGNVVYGTNDNQNSMFRCVEMQGMDHVVDNNIFSAIIREVPSSNDALFLNLPVTYNNTGISSRNALKHGGTFKFTNNICMCTDTAILANTKPHEITYRMEAGFTGGKVKFEFGNNVTVMPVGKTHTIGFRFININNNTVSPTPIDEIKEYGNSWLNCGGFRLDLENDTVQNSVVDFISYKDTFDCNAQADSAIIAENVSGIVSIKDHIVKGTNKNPFTVFSPNLTTKDATTLTDSITIKGNEVYDSIKTGASSAERTIALIQGGGTIMVEDNTNHTAAGTNIGDLAYIETYIPSKVYRMDNVDTSGVTEYQLVYTVGTEDNYAETYVKWNAAKTAAFLVKINEHDRLDTSGGGFNINIPTDAPDGSELDFLDVTGSLGANPATMVYNGTHTIMGAAANFTLNADNAYYKWKLFGTDWRLIISPPISTAQVGIVDSAGSPVRLPVGWGSSRQSVGSYTITFPEKANIDYVALPIPDNITSARFAVTHSKTTTQFKVIVYDNGGTGADSGFQFQVID